MPLPDGTTRPRPASSNTTAASRPARTTTTKASSSSCTSNLPLYFATTLLLFAATMIYSTLRLHAYHPSFQQQQEGGAQQANTPKNAAGVISETLSEFVGGVDPRQRPNADATTPADFQLAGLSCQRFGGPRDELAQEMVYWEDIPSDAAYRSPFQVKDRVQYLTFEPDEGGWNNIRMAMETVLGMAFAMGRTLVLPPEKEMYLLKQKKGKHGEQKNTFSFNHFFHMEAIHNEHPGLDIITMEEFLTREALPGNIRSVKTGQVTYPPDNKRVQWDGRSDINKLFDWLREAHLTVSWNPEECIGVFPASTDPKDLDDLRQMEKAVLQNPPRFEDYVGNPVPIDGTPLERLRENWAGRTKACLYDESLQQATFVHFPVDHKTHARLLVHFYAFLFFQNWRHDLWMKRFIRDHVRYVDEIQCAAARVVAAVRDRARQLSNDNNPDGLFDAFHVRRGDFQYKATRVDADVLLEMAQRQIPDGTLLYMATDERDKSFFDPLKEHYHVVFLDDFHDEALMGINTNFYGMIDQLVATRSRTFFGCWFSTFTGYINRIRGYHADEERLPGYESGIVNSWYYALPDRFDHMQQYHPVKKSFYAREFPTSWRLIDQTLETN